MYITDSEQKSIIIAGIAGGISGSILALIIHFSLYCLGFL
ncbi:MAG: hypothetical protein BWY47_00004 [Bacteroidetes bacterium ADurb.Bin302]|jgi:hypothetical protein|nr:MAG: hypothetical protein BWY47_00004 [Bacteroidetes bacterium ADurb.Bin302]